ncbi:MAG: hypothetical protein JWM76_3378 [Pseudonocardiales bacterium]|nr:hypothetical protein [Pseudonocardiales bacterium]
MTPRFLGSLGLVGLLLTACSSGGGSGGSASKAAVERVRAGYAQIAGDDGYSIDFSIARKQGDDDEKTLSCLSVQSDPSQPDGNHLDITNWGSSAVLDSSGGCQGGGRGASEIFLEGDYVYTVTGPAPVEIPTCMASYRKNVVDTTVSQQLKDYTRSQSPKVDDLLALVMRSSGDNTKSVVLQLDPKKAAKAAGKTSGATPDSETMTVSFADANSSDIEAAEVDAVAGDQKAIFRYKYYKITTEQGSLGVPVECLDGSSGTIKDLDQLKSALGL